MDLGFNIWRLVKTVYTTPTTPPTETVGKKLSENNAKAMNAILSGLAEAEFVKVMHCSSTKEM